MRNSRAGRIARTLLTGTIVAAFIPLGWGLWTSLPPTQRPDFSRAISRIADRASAMLRLSSGSTTRQEAGRPNEQPMTTGRLNLESQAPHDPEALYFGDRMTIGVFENLPVHLTRRTPGTPDTVATIFPRTDLSGEYTVTMSGHMNIPKLGKFAVAGRPLSMVQTDIAAAFRGTFGRPAEVRLSIAERQPVYVVGEVRRPGTFKYRPAMILLQAVADAGGQDTADHDTSYAIEQVREAERLRQAEDRLITLTIDRARLIAQRDGEESINPSEIPARDAELGTHDAAQKALLASATATLLAERRDYVQRLALALRQVAIARSDLDAEGGRAEQLKALIANKQLRLHELEGIAARGSLPRFRLTEARTELAEMHAKQEDLYVALAQAERRHAEAEMSLTKFRLDYNARLQASLAKIEQDIVGSREAIRSIRAVTNILNGRNPDLGSSAAKTKLYRITRRVQEGFVVIKAHETTPLRPGDVVEVGFQTSEKDTAYNMPRVPRAVNRQQESMP